MKWRIRGYFATEVSHRLYSDRVLIQFDENPCMHPALNLCDCSRNGVSAVPAVFLAYRCIALYVDKTNNIHHIWIRGHILVTMDDTSGMSGIYCSGHY